MASSSSPFPFSSASFTDPTVNIATITITPEEFNLFHSIDRKLYARLIFNLGRDWRESIQNMSLWIWFERISSDYRLVSRLLTRSDSMLNILANESLMALNCVQSEKFPPSYVTIDIPVMKSLTIVSYLSLAFFHVNRHSIGEAISRIANNVCIRAFSDIIQIHQENQVVEENFLVPSGQGVQFYGPQPTAPTYMMTQPTMHYGSSSNVGAEWNWVVQGDDDEINYEGNEIAQLLRRLELRNAGIGMGEERNDKGVPSDDRTIFLTFSKGYPISESEVRDFFFRRFGDTIESVHMQEVVQSAGQALYARLVVRSGSDIEVVLDGNSKIKFTINGKHVWARKYVRKNSKSPTPSQPSSPSQIN